MDEEIKAWSEASGLSDHTIKALTKEFVSMQAIKALEFDKTFFFNNLMF